MERRHFLRLAATTPLLSMLGPAGAAAGDYRALVIVFLNGGNDGGNCLIPTDAAYNDYATARTVLALPKASLAPLAGASAGHTFGLHASLAPLAQLYDRGRLGWIANVGPLVQPATARQVIERTVQVPPFLLSHSDQVAYQQGWMGDINGSGWAGRALELLPAGLRNSLNAVTMANERTLVLGNSSAVSFLSPQGARYWGAADLERPESIETQTLNRMSRWQFKNRYDSEYARTFGRSLSETIEFSKLAARSRPPAGDFGSDDLSVGLRKLASMLPVFKSAGFKRQVFLLHFGSFDTHTNQRSSAYPAQDPQLIPVARAMAAFDTAVQAAGMDQDVVSLNMTDFGRTLRHASGGGSDHAWGNHWFAMGGPVAGGQVHGSFPSLVLGGANDGDPNGAGRLVPTTSTDQVGATLMKWMGLADDQLTAAFPNLANFSQKTINLLRT